MKKPTVDQIADAVLYEGYILYPYRASSAKNRERFTFGRVYPERYSAAQNGAEPSFMQTECLARTDRADATFSARIRFLQPMAREVCQPGAAGEPGGVLSEVRIDGQVFQTWREATEREIALPPIPLGEVMQREVDFSFAPLYSLEHLKDARGVVAGILRRRQLKLGGVIHLAVEPLDDAVSRVTVRVTNQSHLSHAQLDDPAAVLLGTFASTHVILQAMGGEFLSLTDPPAGFAQQAAACRNIGAWPVLAGDQPDTMLASPIILSDYPQIAPESPGELFDSTEIDEILSLRVLTMTDQEKLEMRNVDAFARRILERTESLGPDDFMKMHSTLRDAAPAQEVPVRTGDRVRIRPRRSADAMDMILAGKIGLVEAVEHDAEGQVHLALVLEDDPGRDLGMMRQPGHRFFYGLDEIEPLTEPA